MAITAPAHPEPRGLDEVAPAPAPAPPTSGGFPHIRALDGLRGAAVLLVVLSHMVPDAAPGGFLGVDLFFVLSGFLITSLLVGEWETTGGIALGRFWVRRARRLVPALLLVLAFVLLVGLLTGTDAERHRLGLDGLSSLFYVANWRFIASGQSYVMQFIVAEPSPLRHMWSLAIEEQFYLVWPLVVLVVGLVARRVWRPHPRALRAALAVTCAVLGLASVAWMWSEAGTDASLDRLYYGTDSRAFVLLAGALVGALSVGRPQLRGLMRPVAIGFGIVAGSALLVATAMVETGDRWLYRGGFAAIALVLVLLLLGAAQEGPNPLGWLLRLRPLVGLGLISYGVYLWHWPMVVWLTPDRTGLDGVALFVMRAGLTLAASLLSYRFLEQPIRRRGLASLGRARPAVVGASVAALAAGFLVPVVAFPAIPPPVEGETPVAEAVVELEGYAGAPRCDTEGEHPSVVPDRTVRVQVIGNSLAAEIKPCLRAILGQRDAEMVSVEDGAFLICRNVPDIEAQATDPDAPVDAAVLFLFVAYDDRCGEPWHAAIDRLIDTYKANGIHVFLVPSVSVPEGGTTDLQPGIDLEIEYYAARAVADPEHITAIDAGTYLRDDLGTYLWRVPCVTGGEAGCRPDGTVPIRFVDGLHFCTDPDFAVHGCVDDAHAAGERRAASAIAEQMLPVLERDLAPASTGAS
jgi:peptidoglycan/LPS O-acetylase OafA/YrhL